MLSYFQFDVLIEEDKDELPINLNDSQHTGLLSDFKKMFETSDFSDFELKSCDDVVFKVHKNILSVRSPVFFAMLSTEMKETKENAAKIPNIDGATLKELLRFIYYECVENLSEVAEKLFQAAEQYQLDKLKKQCCESLIESLTIDNVIARIVLADRLTGTKKLYSKCMKLILK